MTRILRTRLGEIAKGEVDQKGISAVAYSIGIAENTLRKLLRDEWDYINRDSVERICDHFGLALDQLFQLEQDNFWYPFELLKTCTFVRGSVSHNGTKLKAIHIPSYDNDATAKIQQFLRRSTPNLRAEMIDFHAAADAHAIVEQAASQNCIVIGSPRSNPATEVVVSRFFNAKPFDSAPGNKRKFPFHFLWPKTWFIERVSAMAAEASSEDPKKCCGIALQNGKIAAKADYMAAEEFRQSDISAGSDCGLILVANNPFGGINNPKLIVIAGFSGIGTVAAAQALINDFRDLEPRSDERFMLGVIEATYRKSKRHSDDRELTGYRWVYRKGGRPLQRTAKAGA